jgi:F-type H+-transporting ATPase subunit alpha
VAIFAVNNGYVDEYPTTDVQRYEKEMISFMESSYSDVLDTIRDKKALDDELQDKIKAALDEFKGQFAA